MWTIRNQKKLNSNNAILLVLVSFSLYSLAAIYHGFIVFSNDTINTVPYAFWLNNPELFLKDLAVQQFKELIPHKSWFIPYFLHFFPANISVISKIVHGLFSIILFSGMIRLSDYFLKDLEMSILAVFCSVFSLYNLINGGNELYYNMFISGLLVNSIIIWSFVFYFKNRFFYSSIALGFASIFEPLLTIQIFILFSLIIILKKYLPSFFTLAVSNQKPTKTWPFFAIYLLAIAVLLNSVHNFSDVFITSHIKAENAGISRFFSEFNILFIILSAFACMYYFKKSSAIFYFFMLFIFGMGLLYISNFLNLEIPFLVDWMHISIWIKFLSILGFLGFIQKNIETKHYRIFTLIAFLVLIVIAYLRFDPSFDSNDNNDIYGWVMIHTDENDLFLVENDLSDFKAKTLRSSYFDLGTKIEHKSFVQENTKRFAEIYNLDIADKKNNWKVDNSFLGDFTIFENQEIDYFILKNERTTNKIENSFEKNGKIIYFKGSKYTIYGKK